MLTLTLAAFGGGLLWAILGIGFLIFIHEYGHYTACRLTRTRVETFSIGFGPRLFGWEKSKDGRRQFTWGKRKWQPEDHAMDFRVAVVPLGGYVKMAGENPGQERTGAGDEFSSKSVAQRLLIVVAGVIMNSLTAFVFYTIAIQGGVPKEPPLVGTVEAGTAAWSAGLRTGDRVLEVDGQTVLAFQDLRMEAAFLPVDEERDLVVERDGQRMTLRVKARFNETLGVVQLGLGQPQTLKLGSGAETLEIGVFEPAEVAGVPAVGGAEALARIGDALSAGRIPVEVKAASGRTVALSPRPLKPDEKPPGEKVWRLGLTAFGPPTVGQARGAAQGLRDGDVLVAAVAGEKRLPMDSREALARLPFEVERVDAFVVSRGGKEETVPVVGVADRGAVARLLQDFVLRESDNRMRPIEPGHRSHEGGFVLRYPSSPAEGHVQPGERVVAIQDKPVGTIRDLLKVVLEIKDAKPMTLKVEGADGKVREEKVTPVALEVEALDVKVTSYREPLASDGLLDSIGLGAGRFWREVRNTFSTIRAFFTGGINFSRNIAGPITLVNVSTKASEDSFLELLWWLAYVSVMLAVLNILPIPVLDGGHLIYLVAEKIRGRPLSEGTMALMQWIGLLLLLTLMFFAISNDIKFNF